LRLIVSCHLETMKGCEKRFIESVASHPSLWGLRVEGIENIKFARSITGLFLVGLVKTWDEAFGRNRITVLREHEAIMSAGADMVAGEVPYGSRPFLWDLSDKSYAEEVLPRADELNPLLDGRSLVLSTTFSERGFELVRRMRRDFPRAIINCEGGLVSRGDLLWAEDCGADWVTVGRAINDPRFILDGLA
jgi:putative N-acetylmannosamine-6-phosphate epimerase